MAWSTAEVDDVPTKAPGVAESQPATAAVRPPTDQEQYLKLAAGDDANALQRFLRDKARRIDIDAQELKIS